MDDTKFIELGNYLLNSIRQGKTIIDLANLIKELRLYINNNPNSVVVKFFAETLLRINLSLFKHAYLLKALEIPDCFAYFRQAKIYENLPYTKHPNYAQFLPELLEIPSQIYGNNYATFMYLLKKYLPKEAEDSSLNAIYNFIDSNSILLHSPKDEYYDIGKEKELYTRAQYGQTPAELKDFAFYMQAMDPDTVRLPFMNKRIGNIGEAYTFDLISEAYNGLFVSRDLGNGFGYDLYYVDEDNIETLVEVKTTTSFSEDDNFALSENEYQTMVNTLENPNVRYVVTRVVLDRTLTKPSFIVLNAEDKNTLMDKDNKYFLKANENGKYVFARFNPSRVIKDQS